MDEYIVECRKLRNDYKTKSPQMAMKLFITDVVESEMVEGLGQVMVAKEVKSGKKYPMRVAPALYLAGVITRETAVRGISAMLRISEYEADKMLDEKASEDQWLAEPIMEEP